MLPSLPPPCLTDQKDWPFLSYLNCKLYMPSPFVKKIFFTPENTPSSQGLPPTPPHGPDTNGAASFTAPGITYWKQIFRPYDHQFFTLKLHSINHHLYYFLLYARSFIKSRPNASELIKEYAPRILVEPHWSRRSRKKV